MTIDKDVIYIEKDCDFCGGETKFRKKYDQWDVFSWLEGLDGSGSDYLAIWCGNCGPKHRGYKAPADGFDYCASCNYLEPVASTILRDGADLEEPLCKQCSQDSDCQHPSPADYGASQVKDGVLVHDCADCGLVMAWSVSPV